MAEPISTGRMFELTNKTFRQNFSYITTLAIIFIGIGYLIASITNEFNHYIGDKTVFFIMFLMLIIYAKLAIMIHRLVILNEKNLTMIFKWSVTELKFLGWILITTTVVGLLLFLILKLSFGSPNQNSSSGFINLIFILTMIAMGIIFSRFSLIFPATAAEHDLSLNNAWNLSKNHKLLLFILVILVPYITNRIFRVIPDGQLFWNILIEALSVLIIIYEVGLLSHCYDSLIQKNHKDNQTTENNHIEKR